MSRVSKVEIARGRRAPFRRGALACAFVSSLSACAAAAAEAPRKASPPLPAMADQIAALQEKLDAREALVTQLESRLSLLEAEQRQLRFALAEREAAPVGVRETVRIGAHEAREERASKRETRPVLRLYGERRASEGPLESVPVVDERLPVAPLPDRAGPAPKERTVAEGRDPYVAAIDLVRRRDFGAALRALSQFISDHPDDPRLAKAQFWRGEVLFAQKSYGLALSAFETALQREPQGEKAADSLLKIGLCHRRLGAPERARAAMKQLKAQFPQSNAARLAQAEEA